VNIYRIDLGKCVGCGNCAAVCPEDAITNDDPSVDTALQEWGDYAHKVGRNPTPAQKAHLTRKWSAFVKACAKKNIDPYRYAFQEAQP
jgi:formate hydrogenlyase subunit 6/NADH:ubiquinone oxidoreductase subunit I